MRKTAIGIFILTIVLVLGCQQANVQRCEPPLIQIGSVCCADVNGNEICDDAEPSEAEGTQRATISAAEESDNRDKTFPVKKRPTITLAEFQAGVNHTYYPLRRYAFNKTEEENLTGFENTFDKFESDRFMIYRIKKERDYLSFEENFTQWVKRLYDLRVKNNKILAAEEIDYWQLYDLSWEDAHYVYDYDLQKSRIGDSPVFFQYHVLMLADKNDFIKNYWFPTYYTVWCTPELVVEVYPSELAWTLDAAGNSVDPTKEDIRRFREKEKVEMEQRAGEIIALCSGEMPENQFEANEVVFYGPGGYYPSEPFRIPFGDPFIIHNENTKLEATVITVVNDKSHQVFNTKIIPLRASGNITFPELGSYTFFDPQFAARGKVEVYARGTT